MAGTLLRIGDRPNVSIMEFVIDSENEIQYLPTTDKQGSGPFKGISGFDSSAPLGSICTVGNQGAEVKIYELFSFGWKEL